MTPFVRQQIAAMSGYVPGEQPQQAAIIKLNTNENPYPCSARVADAVAQACHNGLSRYPDPSASAFREAASQVLGVPRDWILCGNGSDELLTIVIRAVVDAGQCIRYPTPSYVLYRTLAEIQAAECQEVRFTSDWTLGTDFVAPSDRLRLVFLANPNSPSGTMIPPSRVLEFAEALPCPLLVDEAYVDFADENCMDLVARCEKIIVTRSMSKSYSLAGLRFGYLVAQPHLVEQFHKVKDSYNCDALSIAGATAAIGDQTWLDDTRRRIIATRQRLARGMQELGFRTTYSQANFVWNTHPDVSVRRLYERLKERGFLVRYMDYPQWEEGLRISVGTDEQIDRMLTLMKEALQA